MNYKQQKTITSVESVENFTENRLQSIIELIKRDNGVSNESLAISLSVKRRTVARDIEKLKTQGILIRKGADKGGYWEVIGKL